MPARSSAFCIFQLVGAAQLAGVRSLLTESSYSFDKVCDGSLAFIRATVVRLIQYTGEV